MTKTARLPTKADATLWGMNERDLRAYAHRGLTARLAELDDERARILVLLAAWDDSARPTLRGKRTEAPLKREDTARALLPPVPERLDFTTPRHEAEIEVARVLPRRRRVSAPAALPVSPALTLPPMPRLVKARAS